MTLYVNVHTGCYQEHVADCHVICPINLTSKVTANVTHAYNKTPWMDWCTLARSTIKSRSVSATQAYGIGAAHSDCVKVHADASTPPLPQVIHAQAFWWLWSTIQRRIQTKQNKGELLRSDRHTVLLGFIEGNFVDVRLKSRISDDWYNYANVKKNYINW